MTALKKNIWLIFIMLVLSGLALLTTLSVSRWNGMMNHYSLSQSGLVKQWFGSFSSILEQQETIISLIGKDIITRQKGDDQNIQNELNAMMDINPDVFAGYALIAADGRVLELTSNLKSDNLPNLLQLPQTKDSFEYTMTTDKMVLGRTYFAPRLVLPARKAIYASDGSLLGVITGALKLKTDSGFFGNNYVLGDFNRITILRTRDRYVQYATNGKVIKGFHEHPIEDSEYNDLMNALNVNSIDSINNTTPLVNSISFKRNTNDGRGEVRGVARYNPRYEFWMISEIEESFLEKEYLIIFFGYLIIMLVFLVGMYLLFRYIDKIDNSSRTKLEFQANHDSLTKLPNRNYLLSSFQIWKSEHAEFSLLFIDLDNFKGVNDNFGHSMGDSILIKLAQKFQQTIDESHLLIRHGGDEFVLLTPNSSADLVLNKTPELIQQACEKIEVDNIIFSPGCSIGIAHFPIHGTALDELLKAADIAMYQAKKERNSIKVFQPSIENEYLYKIRIEQLLKGAEKRGEIYMNYQPQVDANGKLYGVESLVRWHHPELGIIPPDIFIPIAEQTGQIREIGEFIIDKSLGEISEIMIQTGKTFRLSLNISVRQFAEPEFAQHLIKKIRSSGISSLFISIEITENLLIEDLEQVKETLQELQYEGISISLDDFGTGYSSLSILRHLPLDEIKIDKSFVDHIIEDETALKMVKNIIAIGRNYGTTVLAEGVETQGQLECLTTCGCDRFQGYYFSRPLSALALSEYIEK
ncbi:bifunctional diguanylate cyclase/phosphodiesterase [Thalassolituus oleivorans]|uniref:bifunctional diguanylate cyclase/phosphodiesterase n=1 Tax=Thalassolituus oleivorans TaxID=187493 RepID=UPI0023F0793F|nr:EAL domain-containing protein [Thalassolituus oleivorans]